MILLFAAPSVDASSWLEGTSNGSVFLEQLWSAAVARDSRLVRTRILAAITDCAKSETAEACPAGRVADDAQATQPISAENTEVRLFLWQGAWSYSEEHEVAWHQSGSLTGLADTFREHGNHKEAERHYRAALKAIHDGNYPETEQEAYILNHLAWLLFETKRIHEASPIATQSVAMYRSVGAKSLDYAYAMDTLAHIAADLGVHHQAQELFSRAVAMERELAPSETNLRKAYATFLRQTSRAHLADKVDAEILQATQK